MKPIVLVMGVCGTGKSAIGSVLAERLQVPFLEGDAFHSAENVDKMRAGIPLTDVDRADWLSGLAETLSTTDDSGAVLACSALKRRYRDVLRRGQPRMRLVFLNGSVDTIAGRMAQRPDHYMPASLLASQLADLEPPQADEPHCALSIEQPPQHLVAAALRYLVHPTEIKP